jgi:hypothetical protein
MKSGGSTDLRVFSIMFNMQSWKIAEEPSITGSRFWLRSSLQLIISEALEVSLDVSFLKMRAAWRQSTAAAQYQHDSGAEKEDTDGFGNHP